jgi:glycosyltransferase involved in cell wall biosynthesis
LELPISQLHYARRASSALPARLGWYAKHASYSARLLPILSTARRLRPAIIHFQWNHIPLVETALVKVLRRIAPVVHTAHDTRTANGDQVSALKNWKQASLLQSFDLVVTHTEQGRSRLLARGLAPDRITVMPHGPLDGGLPQARHLPDDRVHLLLFGVLKPYKGISVLLKAAELLPAQIRQRIRISIVGEPVDSIEPWTKMIEAADLSDFVSIVPGHVSQEDLPAVLGKADVFLFPYLEIEASGILMMCLPYCRPIIASRLGAFAELLIDGLHGVLVEPGNEVALAKSIESLATDPNRRAQMGRNVGQLASKIPAWSVIGARMAELYRNLVEIRQMGGRTS